VSSGNAEGERDWARYRRAGNQPIEAMQAHFSAHVYHRHSHDSYSFGMTETGAQAFTRRGGSHVSAAGMVAPSDYQRQLRLREARRLLGTGVPAAQVATDVGFADQAHLTRFRRCYGVTPGAYRQAAC
jgi:AraC-like DNA-binding protein